MNHLSPRSTTAILFYTWLANMLQLVLSILYVAVNNYLTTVCSAYEWNNLATKRKTLRVTKPGGQQRSTYFLQLPYPWTLPLTVASGRMHWVLLQTIYLSRLDRLDGTGQLNPAASVCTCGYSTLSLLVLMALLSAELLCVWASGFVAMQLKLPFAGDCSLVLLSLIHI